MPQIFIKRPEKCTPDFVVCSHEPMSVVTHNRGSEPADYAETVVHRPPTVAAHDTARDT